MAEELRFMQEPEPEVPLKHFWLNDDKFYCVGEIPGTRILEHEAILYGGTRGIAAQAMLDFFAEVMGPVYSPDLAAPYVEGDESDTAPKLPNEYERFRAYVDDPARRIKLETVGKIYQGLIHSYTGFPTSRPSGSSDGPPNTNGLSTENSPSPVST